MDLHGSLETIDATHYATSLRCVADTLSWNAMGNTHTLLVRMPYGTELSVDGTFIDELDKAMAMAAPHHVADGMTVEFLHRTGNGTPIVVEVTFIATAVVPIFNIRVPHRHARYMVLACNLDGNAATMTVYRPTAFVQCFCDVPAQVHVAVELSSESSGGLFRKSKRFQYRVHFDEQCDYEGTGVFYTFDGYGKRYPVTKAMMGKTVAILAPQQDGQPVGLRWICEDPGFTVSQ